MPPAAKPTPAAKPRFKSRGTCREPGCSKPIKARGLCGMHYSRVTRAEQAAPTEPTADAILQRVADVLDANDIVPGPLVERVAKVLSDADIADETVKSLEAEVAELHHEREAMTATLTAARHDRSRLCIAIAGHLDIEGNVPPVDELIRRLRESDEPAPVGGVLVDRVNTAAGLLLDMLEECAEAGTVPPVEVVRALRALVGVPRGE